MSDKITIRRAKHDKDNPYFLMRRDTAQDHSISAEALGILTEILSRPDDWRVSPEQLSNRVNTKRARVYRILKELIAARYIERIYHRDSHGRVQWVEYIVHECPLLVISQQVVNQDVAKQDVEIQHNTNKRVKQSTEVTKDSVAAGAATDSGQAPEEPEPQGQLDSEYDTWKAKIENLPAHAPTPRPGGYRPNPNSPELQQLVADVEAAAALTPQGEEHLMTLAVERVLGMRGRAAGPFVRMLMGRKGKGDFEAFRLDTPASATELQDWALWYERKHPNLNKPTTPIKLHASIMEYRHEVEQAQAARKAPPQPRTTKTDASSFDRDELRRALNELKGDES